MFKYVSAAKTDEMCDVGAGARRYNFLTHTGTTINGEWLEVSGSLRLLTGHPTVG